MHLRYLLYMHTVLSIGDTDQVAFANRMISSLLPVKMAGIFYQAQN